MLAGMLWESEQQEVVTSGDIKGLGALGNQVVLQAGELQDYLGEWE